MKKLEIVQRAGGDAARVKKLGPYEIEALLTREEEGATSVYRVRIGPNETTNVSYHKIAEEFYYVLAGQGTAILNGEPREIRAGELLRLPPGTTHGFITRDEPLEMLNFHTPGCRPDHDVYFVGGPAPEGFGPA